MNHKSFLLSVLFGISCLAAMSQVRTDSADVTGVYKKLEEYSTKRKFTSTLHSLMIRPIQSNQVQKTEIKGQILQQSYSEFEGKIIRNINITTLDPFGYKVRDTVSAPLSILEKSGNALHIKTLHVIIKNRLLVKKHDTFDSLLVKESERLVRNLNYIHDVAFRVVPAGAGNDSVDIYIRTGDLWSIVPDGALSETHFTIKLSDINLGGIGHTFSHSYTQNIVDGRNGFSGYYYIPNIRNSYISSRFVYYDDENHNYARVLDIQRPFFSPVARWAGGVQISTQKQKALIYKNDTTRQFLESKIALQEYWAAWAWQIFKGKSVNNRSTKLIFSGRMMNLNYLERPEERPDLYDYFTNERFYLAGIGVSGRKYVQQNYVYRTGTPEDVPVGIAYGAVIGYQIKNNWRWYWGLRHSWGNIYNWGYLGTNLEYGTFVNKGYKTQQVYTASINYFTPLFTIGNWKFRQFVRPELTVGLRRSAYDYLTLNDGYGLNGFNSDVLAGTSRFLLSLQTQSYAPWNVLGFRFGPYLNLSLGMLGNESSGFSKSRLYPQLGFGVLIRNDYLVVRYFQLSFAYYPSIPGKGENIFKLNPMRTTDFGFPDFIIGKPEVVEFR